MIQTPARKDSRLPLDAFRLEAFTFSGGGVLIPMSVLSEMGKGPLRGLLLMPDRDEDHSEKLQNFWQNLLGTAMNPAVEDKYLTATCNSLCIFIQNAFPGSSHNRELFGSPKSFWFKCFRVVSRTLAEGKPKPALQLLEALVQSLGKSANPNTADEIWRRAVRSMLTIVILGEPSNRVKEALVVLTRLLRDTSSPVDKSLALVAQIMADDRLAWTKRRSLCLEPCIASGIFDSPLAAFVLSIFFARESQYSRNAAVKLFSNMLKLGFSELMEQIGQIMEFYIASSSANLDEFANDIFPSFLVDASKFQNFIATYRGPMTSTRLCLFLAMLQMGRDQGYIEEKDLPFMLTNALFGNSRTDSSSYDAFASLLAHADSRLRSQTYRLLIWSPKTTVPIPTGVLTYVAAYLKQLHDEGDAQYRGDILSATSRLVERLYCSFTSLRKRNNSETVQGSYSTFLSKTANFLHQELCPGVSYQRHIISLQTIWLLVSTGSANQDLNSLKTTLTGNEVLLRSLLVLLLDPFDDVRHNAMEILREMSQLDKARLHKAVTVAEGLGFVERAERLAATTCRSDHADGLGRLYSLATNVGALQGLLPRVEGFLWQRESFELPLDFPLHGILLGLMYGISHGPLPMVSTHRLLSVCSKIWTLVQLQLCIDSPEFANEEIEDDSVVGPKDVLAYAWRALRDSSLLLRAMLENLDKDEILYGEIGELCLEQLITLRHRGAFSTVAQTFTLCCQSLGKLSYSSASKLRSNWYQLAIKQVADQSTRLTRRSAGLPATMTCVLDPKDSSSVSGFIECLTEIALQPAFISDFTEDESQEPSLPQVHALNCLREIMTNSRFRAATERHIIPLLELSTTSFSAEAWAIRNCGLMLFRACVVRLERQQGAEAYPTDAATARSQTDFKPAAVALRLLKEPPSPQPDPSTTEVNQDVSSISQLSLRPPSKAPEVVFAALDLINRCHLISPAHNPELCNQVKMQLGNPIWAIRTQAAGLFTLSKQSGAEADMVVDLFHLAGDISNQNFAHGALLCSRNHLQWLWSFLSPADLKKTMSEVCHLLRQVRYLAFDQVIAPTVRAEFTELCNDALAVHLQYSFDDPVQLAVLMTGADISITRSPTELFDGMKQDEKSLLQAQAVNKSFEILLHHTEDPGTASMKLFSLYESLAFVDADVARYLLAKLKDLRWPIKYSRIWTSFLCEVIQVDHADDLASQGMVILSEWLVLRPQDITTNRLIQAIARVNAVEPASRSLFTAKLRIQSVLLGLAVRNRDMAGSKVFRCALRQWILAFRVAARDDVEEPTRLAAVKSLSAYLSLRGTYPPYTFDGSCEEIDILVDLYLLVRDDDNDIRRVASQTISSLLTHTGSTGTVRSPMTPLAAGDALIGYLQHQYKESTHFVTIALSKVMGTDVDLASHCRPRPVSNVLRNFLRNADSLFAEESQNLYLDCIYELELWSETLKVIGVASLAPSSLRSYRTWVSNGLRALEEFLILERLSTKYPFGPTFRPEVLVVFVRVIRLAGVFLSAEEKRRLGQFRELPSETDQTFTVSTAGMNLLEQLESLAQTASECRVHEQVFKALKWARKIG